MLAYAAQGLQSDKDSQSAGQLREFLNRAVKALEGLAESCDGSSTRAGPQASRTYQAFLAVLDRDARDSLAAIELVLAQPAISSQLIDNLNASIHLRALLTDLFLVGEIFRTQRLTPGLGVRGPRWTGIIAHTRKEGTSDIYSVSRSGPTSGRPDSCGTNETLGVI